MGEFFKPRRRKIGVVALAMSCVFATGWIRSYRVQDTFVIGFGTGASVELLSACKSLIFVSAVHQTPSNPPKASFLWMTHEPAPDEWYFPIDANLVTSSKSAEFKLHQAILPVLGTVHYFRAFQLPYWSIVLPLILLSAHLLLSKARAGAARRPSLANSDKHKAHPVPTLKGVSHDLSIQ